LYQHKIFEALLSKDLRSFEISLEFESAVPIRFDSKVMGRFQKRRTATIVASMEEALRGT